MTNPDAVFSTTRFEVRATADSHFGWIRTRLSLERTMMSELRTAISLVGFGFAIVQFYERLGQMPGALPAYFPEGQKYLGLALILCGVLTLVIAIWQYRWGIRYMWSGSFVSIAGVTKDAWQSPQIAIAILLIVIGLCAFFAVLFRLT